MGLVNAFVEMLSIGEVMLGVCVFMSPVWIAFVLGLMVGWAWKPKWVSSIISKLQSLLSFSPALVSPLVIIKDLTSAQSSESLQVQTTRIDSSVLNGGSKKEQLVKLKSEDTHSLRSSHTEKDEGLAVTEEDFKHLSRLVDRKDGGLPWRHMMEGSTDDLSYQAWIREPETGPPQYCTRTVYEDATPEMLRDFYWDDEFRLKWDDMILNAETVKECPTTGTVIVHWIRKFPFFCSDREYIIGRRIWESGRSYYCVTKGVPFSSIARRQKPRRVDLFYSSWFIKAVESRKGNGQLSACEVILFHHEDMGIPWEIAKFGVRRGMWGAVRTNERGFRAYQKERASESSLSRCAFMAQINTKIDPDHLKSLEDDVNLGETEVAKPPEKQVGMNIPKLIVFGGAVALACSLDQGLLTKAVIFSVARRFGNIGRGAFPRTQL
ncbi:START domain-containing protein [Heracleum sosnowskyi]|uniref:START domain-containing protein n=1 Tax=Heracleum sosnowskyi TaxID=360622 RepID=A0AAD8J8T5_9APIA|nr:START domain-containing protein [Heracleum sosnowskyi]